MTRIHFIVNPVAGHGKSPLSREYLEPFFIKGVHHLTVKHSEYKKHAILLTEDSIKEGADIIVACGGDGTINEVASCLVNTSIPLGIIPIGSGNGLASNLHIPKNLRRALAIIRNQETVKIDVGQIGGHYFFSNTGIGFDADVIKYYESWQKHTLYGYARACLASLRNMGKNQDLTIDIDADSHLVNPFIVLISNSNQLGYHVTLTPKASLRDGLLDVLIISKISRLKMLWLGLLIVLRRINWLKEARYFQTKELCLSREGSVSFESQIDGELHEMEHRNLRITIQENSLNILVAG